MWIKVWLLMGRESEIPNPGDWQMEPIGREEILMIRQKDNGIKAFYNVCQHGGNPLVDEPKGSNPRRFFLSIPQLVIFTQRAAAIRARQGRFPTRQSLRKANFNGGTM